MADKPSNIKSTLDLVREAQAETQTAIDDIRVDLLEKLFEQQSIGGKDEIKDGVMKAVEKFRTGVPFPFLESAFPGFSLTEVINKLIAEGKIQQLGKRGKVVIKAIVQEAATTK